MEDTEKLVVMDILTRQSMGIKKYGQTAAQNPLPLRAWLQHAYEEVLDQAVYLKRAIQQIDVDEEQIKRNKAGMDPLWGMKAKDMMNPESIKQVGKSIIRGLDRLE
jgi:hypothetical protein